VIPKPRRKFKRDAWPCQEKCDVAAIRGSVVQEKTTRHRWHVIIPKRAGTKPNIEQCYCSYSNACLPLDGGCSE